MRFKQKKLNQLVNKYDLEFGEQLKIPVVRANLDNDIPMFCFPNNDIYSAVLPNDEISGAAMVYDLIDELDNMGYDEGAFALFVELVLNHNLDETEKTAVHDAYFITKFICEEQFEDWKDVIQKACMADNGIFDDIMYRVQFALFLLYGSQAEKKQFWVKTKKILHNYFTILEPLKRLCNSIK